MHWDTNKIKNILYTCFLKYELITIEKDKKNVNNSIYFFLMTVLNQKQNELKVQH